MRDRRERKISTTTGCAECGTSIAAPNVLCTDCLDDILIPKGMLDRFRLNDRGIVLLASGEGS
jgi:hypothetical protein